MTDSSSFSSLLALVDSHLSKTTIQESRSEGVENGPSNHIPIPSLSGGLTGTLSENRLSFSPGQRLPIPSFSLRDSNLNSNQRDNNITHVLSEQIANMLKAKELKRQQEVEQERLRLEVKKPENDWVIDLMQALHSSSDTKAARKQAKEETISSSSSFESLFEPKFIDCDDEPVVEKLEPLLPCIQDMSYILYEKVLKAKCSTFGKVLTARIRPVAAPYLRDYTVSNKVKRFDFKTKSPCDCVKEKLMRPTTYYSEA